MAARLREIDEMKEKFYSTVSHELRSPLNAMQEAARLIEAKSAGPLTPKQERLIAIFQKGTGAPVAAGERGARSLAHERGHVAGRAPPGSRWRSREAGDR